MQCTHYWLDGKRLVPSGIPAGKDVGRSPFVTPDENLRNAGGSGVYKCSLDIRRSDLTLGLFVFFGQIGDAASVRLVESLYGNENGIPIPHGLFTDDSHPPVYMRVIPFFLPLRDLYRTEGTHLVEIQYDDLVFPQSGMRTGAPTIETMPGVARRFVSDSPSLTVYILEFFGFFGIALFSLCWMSIPFVRRAGLAATSLVSMAMIFSVTSIPRMLISPLLAIRINRALTVMVPLVILLSHMPYFSVRSPRSAKVIIFVFGIFSVLAGGFLYLEPPTSSYFSWSYYVLLIFGFIAAPWLACIAILRRRLAPRFIPGSGDLIAAIFAMIGAIDARDILYQFVTGTYPSVFLFYSICLPGSVLCGLAAQIIWDREEKKVSRETAVSNTAVLNALSSGQRRGGVDIIAQCFATLAVAERSSIVEIIDDTHSRLVGVEGIFREVMGDRPILKGSLLEKVLQSQDRLIVRALPWFPAPADRLSDSILLPIFSGKRIIAIACVTNFRNMICTPFLTEALVRYANESAGIVALALADARIEEQAAIVEMSHLRVHPARILTEKWFFRNFELSRSDYGLTFIMCDLNHSTFLRATFKDKLRETIEQALSNVFERFKHTGLLIDSFNGDELQFIFPPLLTDKGPQESVERAYSLILHLVSGDSELAAVSQQKLGISISCSMVLSRLSGDQTVLHTDASHLRLFRYMQDHRIDLAARILKSVAGAGEALITDSALNCISDRSRILTLPPQRLRGVPETVSVSMIKHVLKSA